MAQASVDWSWGQPIHTQPFNEHGKDQASLGGAPSDITWSFGQSLSHQHQQEKPADPFPNGYRINAFRTAVPSPALSETMPSLSLQPAPPVHARTPSFAGRKRSCAEISDDDSSSDPNGSSSRSGGASGSPAKFVRTDTGESIYEQRDSDAMDATSQTGVWAEELAERLRSSSFPGGASRPRTLESRKSIRMDPEISTAPPLALVHEEYPGSEHDSAMALDDAPQIKRRNTISDTTLPHSTNQHTYSSEAHDEARLTLGIGWSAVPATPIMFAAARGWSRYIETGFGLRNVRILWRNEGIGAFLVSGVCPGTRNVHSPGSPGYFLFDEDLTQGRLVARSWERAIDGLRAVPMEFDGKEIMALCSEWGMARGEEEVDERAMGMEIE